MGFGRACAPVRCAHPSFWAHCHPKRGAARPPPPIAASLLLIRPQKPNKIYWTRDANVMGIFLSTGPQRLWNMRSLAPAPPSTASLILLTIFLGSTYCTVCTEATIRPNYFVFFYSFWIFSFCYSLFLLSLTLRTYPSFWGVFQGGQAYFDPCIMYIPVRP